MNRLAGIVGSLIALLAVALGAFGAHALKDRLTELENVYVWETAVDYQIWHALALLFCSLVRVDNGPKRFAQYLFAGGILLFSGSLYWLALDGPRWLGPITPLGGLSLILGWCCLAVVFFKKDNAHN